MKICFDATPCSHASGGVGSYTKELFTELARNFPDDEFVGLHAEKLDDFDIAKNLCFTRSGRSAVKIPDHSLWTMWNLPRTLRKEQPDLFHATYAAIAPRKMPQVMTVHDMGFFDLPTMYPRRWLWYWGARMKQGIERSQRIIAVSEWTKERLVHWFPEAEEKIRVVHLGVAQSFAEVTPEDVQCIRGIIEIGDRPFVLAVGTNQPRKNFERLVRAFGNIRPELPEGTQLVFAGSDGWLENLDKCIARENLEAHVKRIGVLSSAALHALYAAATVVASVSLYEGFDLPLLEAMKAGASIVASDIPPHREIVGGSHAVKFVSPTSEEEIGEGLIEMMSRSSCNEAAQERASHFTWKRTAEETMKVYKEIQIQ